MTDTPFDLSRAFHLTGRTAIVVGAGSVGQGVGIGRATAVLLAQYGARVGLLDLNEEAARQTLETVREVGGSGLVVQVDVSDSDALQAAIHACAAKLDGIHTLVNNVGIVGPPGDATDTDLAAWDVAMNVNVRAVVAASGAAIPHMARLGGGAIINMTSISGLAGGYPALSYATTKGALVNLTRAMAHHHGRQGIRVNAVAPGQLYTPRVASRGMSADMRASRAAFSPLGTEGTAWDAAAAVLYLASDAARWITGVVLPVDAGISAVLPLESPPSGTP